jgi:hypothetical protein
MTPVALSTRRIRWFSESAKKTLPAASTAAPIGPFRSAFVASPPSPEKSPPAYTPAPFPVPASLVITCETASTFLTRLPPDSQT